MTREQFAQFLAELKNASDNGQNIDAIVKEHEHEIAESTNYRHKVQLQNQEQQVYFDRQTVTLIEVEKFLKNAQNFADDNSRLAQWLRAIDTLNRGSDFSEYAQDPVFGLLQNEVKMSNFSSRYLMTEAMMVLDKDYIFYDAQDKKARKMATKMLLKNKPIEEIVEFTELSEADVLAIKAEIDQM